MAKELLLYTGIYSFTSEMMINALNENMTDEVVLRVNSPGGDVSAAWGLFAKVAEHGNVHIKVDGMAASGAWNLLLYAKKVTALDVSDFIIHRAASYREDDPETKQFVQKTNADLRKRLEARVTAQTFKEVTGYSLDELFDHDKRINIFLTAKQMKKLGIVSKIVKLEPAEMKQMAQAMAEWKFQAAAKSDPEDEDEDEDENVPVRKSNKTKPDNDMTIEEIKAKYPAVYASIIAEGVKKEKDRVGAWMAYVSLDAKKVVDGIEKGEEVTPKVMAEMQMIGLSAERLEKLKAESAKDVSTEAATKQTPATDAAAKALAEFEKDVHKQAGLKAVA